MIPRDVFLLEDFHKQFQCQMEFFMNFVAESE
jgi:hypothetical protein